jgi:hypothetical protein
MTPKQKAMEIINKWGIEYEITNIGHGYDKRWKAVEIFYPVGMMNENESQSSTYGLTGNFNMWTKAMDTLNLIDEYMKQKEVVL